MDRNEILKNLMLYSIRKNKIEDMRLEIKEYELCEEIPSIGYDEKVDCSIKCKNNDELLLKRDQLNNRIEFYKAATDRIDIWLNYLKKDITREAIKWVYLDKKSKSETARHIDRTTKQVNNLLKRGVDEIYEAINEI